MPSDQFLSTQEYLIDAIGKYASVKNLALCYSFKNGWPCFVIGYLVAERKRVSNGKDARPVVSVGGGPLERIPISMIETFVFHILFVP